jgi:hypothetical protein
VTRARELRKAKRVQKRNAAAILLDGGGNPIPCVLWDISDGGARIAAPHVASLPNVFALSVAKGRKAPYFCRVVWRRNGQIGLRFIDETAANIDLSPRPAYMRRSHAPAPVAPRTDAAQPPGALAEQLVLPGCGPQVALEPASRAVSISSLAFVMLGLLAAATAVFALAGMQSDAAWSQDVCERARNFCQHPEWTGYAAAVMGVIYLTACGMER